MSANGAHLSSNGMNDSQLLRYSRHILLDEIGVEAQERLLKSTALVVGAGGLGSPAALYLASAGVGRILLADPDDVDLTNLQRQILHRERSIGEPKVLSGQRALAELNPDVEVIPLQSRLSGDVLNQAVAQADVVLDCCDNFATRHAVNRACVTERVPLVSGAAIRFDGQLAVFDPRQADSPCYHCVFPQDQAPEEVRCAVMGVFAPLTGVVGTLQAVEALKLLGGFGTPATGRLLLIATQDLRFDDIRLNRDPACAVCGRPSARHV
jgi:molybdopterin/thiamine biosynthesis adenylyltransferase